MEKRSRFATGASGAIVAARRTYSVGVDLHCQPHSWLRRSGQVRAGPEIGGHDLVEFCRYQASVWAMACFMGVGAALKAS